MAADLCGSEPNKPPKSAASGYLESPVAQGADSVSDREIFAVLALALTGMN